MAFVTRFRIEDLNGRFWTGAEFSRDEDVAEEYRDEDEAAEAAVEIDGYVVEFRRPGFDLPRAPFHLLQAAE
jgi:hypothetical protein